MQFRRKIFSALALTLCIWCPVMNQIMKEVGQENHEIQVLPLKIICYQGDGEPLGGTLQALEFCESNVAVKFL